MFHSLAMQAPYPHHRPAPQRQHQRGLSLVELMVGLSIGLLVVAVAMGALVASRGISGTVSDASSIQQQAAYAMRVIGQQMRQSGSLYLDMSNDNVVVFLKRKGSLDVLEPDTNNPGRIFTLGFSADEDNISKDCLGGPGTPNANDPITSKFEFDADNNVLRCTGTGGGTAQPIVSNVADFQVRYLVQTGGADGDSKIAYQTDPPDNLQQVQGLEVCLVLYGNERIDMPSDTDPDEPAFTYSGCSYDADGAPEKINLTTLTGERNRRMHLTFRNVFQLRGQGVL